MFKFYLILIIFFANYSILIDFVTEFDSSLNLKKFSCSSVLSWTETFYHINLYCSLLSYTFIVQSISAKKVLSYPLELTETIGSGVQESEVLIYLKFYVKVLQRIFYFLFVLNINENLQ